MKGIETLSAFSRAGIRHVSLEGRGVLCGAVSTVVPSDSYSWHGLNRGGDPLRPFWLFQYTLSGQGFFQSGRQPQAVRAGQAFCAAIPSDHLYHQDPMCPSWNFFWMIVNDSYVTERLLRHSNLNNVVLTLPFNSPVIRAASTLLLHLLRGDAMDIYQLEEHLFRWMLECERRATAERHPIEEKSRLMEFVRSYTLTHLDASFSIGKLSRVYGLGRSNFSHYFSRITGRSPAAFVSEIRLEEAIKLLCGSSDSIKEIAAQTGFTDSNHLCKSFRRHFNMSPGTYRQIHRSA